LRRIRLPLNRAEALLDQLYTSLDPQLFKKDERSVKAQKQLQYKEEE
jgi:hypothetical protein